MRAWLAVLAVLLGVASASLQSSYPDKVRFIVGFTAGIGTDLTVKLGTDPRYVC